jgi:hypothetical protein
MNLSLSPELEERLRQEARRRGVPPDAITVELLDKHLPHAGAATIRRHDAFLSGYAPEDEGLYDDFGQ